MEVRTRARSFNPAVPPYKRSALEIGFWAFILIAVGRVGELIPGLSSIPAAKITLAIALIVLVQRWKSLPGFAPSVKPMLRNAVALMILVILLTPFSFWPGASLGFLLNQLPVLIAVMVIAYKMSRDWSAVRGTLLVFVIAGLALTVAALSGFSGGRAAAATMYDTNDLAYLLVTVFPLAVGFAVVAQKKMHRIVYIGSAAGLVIATLLTSSRGGVLGLVAVLALMVWLPIKPLLASDGKRRKKPKLLLPLLGVIACAAIVFPQLPLETRERIASIANLGSDYNLDTTNRSSRSAIWKRGMTATAQRPVGYGVGAFPMVDFRTGGNMLAPHNSFVQVVTELGVLGLILFLRMYYLAIKGLSRARASLLANSVDSRQWQEQVVFTRMLQIALVGNAVAGFFLSMAYATLLWSIFSIAMACIAVANPAETQPQARKRTSLGTAAPAPQMK